MLTYRYSLPCGHDFLTATLSVADDDGWHWFPCPCGKDNVLTDQEADAALRRPSRVNGTTYSDAQLAVALDNMIKRERVILALRLWKDSVPLRVIASWCNVSVQLVNRLSAMGFGDD